MFLPLSDIMMSFPSLAIHVAQSWFHSKLSRDEAQKLITQQGLIDGYVHLNLPKCCFSIAKDEGNYEP